MGQKKKKKACPSRSRGKLKTAKGGTEPTAEGNGGVEKIKLKPISASGRKGGQRQSRQKCCLGKSDMERRSLSHHAHGEEGHADQAEEERN